MRMVVTGGLFLLAGCHADALTPAQQDVQDERDIAMVEKANRGAGVPINPQPILLPDMEANSLFGAGCAFVADKAGLGAVMLARTDAGYLKLNDTVTPFAADKGGKALPYGVHKRYVGKSHALQLEFSEAATLRSGTGNGNFNGRLRVQDAKGHIVYDEHGTVQCGKG
jgi:hypothetical protein